MFKDEQSKTGEAIREAYDRVPEDTKPEHVAEEVLAYMVENYPETTLIRRVISLIKRVLVKMGLSPDIFTAADFAALADIAVRVNSLQAKKSLEGKVRNSVSSKDGNRTAKSDTRGNVGDNGYVGSDSKESENPFSLSMSETPQTDRISPVTRKTINSLKFKEWFGKSVLVRKNGDPMPLFHGSATFGVDNSAPWAFSNEELGNNTGSPMAGLGHFFAVKRNEAAGYSKGTGNVKTVFIRLENPKYLNSDQLPTFNSVDEAIAYRNRLRDLGDHDGIIIKDEQHVIIFDPNQAKSADQNTGEFSRENNDIRYSMANATPKSPLSTENLSETAKQMGSITHLKNSKPDSTFLDRIFSTPEYYFKKFAAAGRVLQAALLRRDIRHTKETESFQTLLNSSRNYAKRTKQPTTRPTGTLSTPIRLQTVGG